MNHERTPRRVDKRRRQLAFFVLLCLPVLCLVPRISSAEPQAIRSRSGQFIVRGLALAAPPTLNSGAPVRFVRLDPSVLAVSCEQTKQALLRELGLADQWRGTIQIQLHPVAADDEPIKVIAVGFTDGWCYRLEIPEQVDRQRLFRALVEVLLQEIANRRAGTRPSELPAWLVDGFVQHLQAISTGGLTLQPETRVMKNLRRPDPLAHVRDFLRTNQPLTLQELSWPAENRTESDELSAFRACSHLLLSELLRLKGGRKCLTDFLAALADYLNWQSAFLPAYREHFPTLASFDKWWALNIVNFSGREQMFLWGGEATLRQLESIVTIPVQVRTSRHELPLLTRVKLQNVIAEWAYTEHSQLLLQKANHLQALRLRSPQEYVPLVDGYRDAILYYLEKRGKSGRLKGPPSAAARVVIADTVRKLDRIDADRVALSELIEKVTPMAVRR